MLQTVDEIYKVASVALSPNVPAQIFVSEQISHVVLFYAEADTSFWQKLFIWFEIPSILQMGLMVNPPKPGDISYDQFARERYVF